MLLLSVLAMIFIAPRYVLTFGVPTPVLHTGVGPGNIRVYNYEIVVAAALAVGWKRSPRLAEPAFWPFLVVLAFLAITVWDRSPLVTAGVLHFAFACLAYTVGRRMARKELRTDETRLLLRGIAAILVFELLAGGLALYGFQLPLVGESDNQAVVGRLAGTTSHPNTLGKYVALISVLALPLTRSLDRETRRIAWCVLVMALVVAALTGGRAVLVGLGLALVLWTLLYRSAGAPEMPRLVKLVLLGAMVAPFAAATLGRFGEDPEGGSRPLLLEVFWENIGAFLVWGAGPNTYVETLSNFSVITAVRQLPVHNAVLLSLAEFGVVCWALFWMPILAVYLRAVMRVTTGRGDGSGHALALAASFPMILLLTLTGWGMVAGPGLTMWLLILGFMSEKGRVGDAHLDAPGLPLAERSQRDSDLQFDESERPT
ncbi:O-antigen ligase family protein [Aeromicrobium wangtongii]|uniref:O-antigen ligase-related domain-containing protein n=1 Tax=Aeromicrobium wangtongii TaxID=2969247 RepID=A0ABY5MAS1_9ACTN|nr:O-antigen ligase family protein [Aeromicrobium wangtongii]MCD9199489.1 hypothetical protein [Aeromicrobium wangtongii]UUP13842.1 hypothetical protein NQV15_00590 [Aeromicrobium wangtongii]